MKCVTGDTDKSHMSLRHPNLVKVETVLLFLWVQICYTLDFVIFIGVKFNPCLMDYVTHNWHKSEDLYMAMFGNGHFILYNGLSL